MFFCGQGEKEPFFGLVTENKRSKKFPNIDKTGEKQAKRKRFPATKSILSVTGNLGGLPSVFTNYIGRFLWKISVDRRKI